VLIHWDRRGAGAFRRFLGPGVMRSAMLLLGGGGACLGALSLLGFVLASARASTASTDPTSVLLFAGYALAFFVFVVGLGAFLRARSSAPLIARVLLFALLFGISVGPWVVAAIAGLLSDHGGDRNVLVVAAPSPFYVFVMIESLTRSGPEALVGAGLTAMTVWALLGLLLLAVAARRCEGIIRRHEALLAEGDRQLAAEDEAARAAMEPSGWAGGMGGLPPS
jgi:hypothetical protein